MKSIDEFQRITLHDCWRCQAKTQHVSVAPETKYEQSFQFGDTGSSVEAYLYSFIYRCSVCYATTFFLVREGWYGAVSALNGLPPSLTVVHRYPSHGSVSDPAIKANVAKALAEAEQCLSIGALNASATMARKAIDLMAKDLGETKGTLGAKLERLHAKGKILTPLYHWAVGVKEIGNAGAHGGKTTEELYADVIFEDVTIEQAEGLLKIVREILKYVYVLPEHYARIAPTKPKLPQS